MGHLAFGISTTGYFEFERRNNIYDQKFSFLFDIYEMDRYTLEQNWEILKIYFQSEFSTQTVRNLRGKFGRKEMPSTQFVERIRQTGSLLDKATRPVRSTENIAAVAQSMLEQPSTSTRSQNLNISCTSLRRILNKDLDMKPYKVQLV